jgi:ABC-type glycerol-3-phosphate transport system permease component
MTRQNGLRRVLERIALWIAIALILVWTLFPIWWALTYSIKPQSYGYRTVLVPLLDFRPTLSHWRWEWQNRHDSTGLYYGLRNSLIVGLGSAVCCVALGLLTALGLMEFRRARRVPRAVLAMVLAPKLVPVVVLSTPILLLATALHINDTLGTLVVVHTLLAMPIAILVIDAAVREIPLDILSAAVMDGASSVELIRRMIVPLTAPVLGAVAVLSFALSWNEFLIAVTNAYRNAATAPISIAFLDQRDGVDFEHVGSHIVLIIVVPLCLAVLTQRVLVRGLALGAVRG